MSVDKTFAVLGGDMRQVGLSSRLAQGYSVLVWGLPSHTLPTGVQRAESWQKAIEAADAVVLPLPASPDSKHLHMPLGGEEEQKPPLIADVLTALPPHVFLAGGRFSPAVKEILARTGVRAFDYFENEDLQQRNAIPTAEGAVEILMHEVPRTVHGLPVVIAGFGRVGRALASLLLAMGAEVTVVARRENALLAAKCMGCHTRLLNGAQAFEGLSDVAAVFNTVPYPIFDAAALRPFTAETLFIDLASAPGGFDAAAVAAGGMRVIFALSLPGKYAPLTAGEIIADTILARMREEGLL
ncbi:MAG: dipicolinate synthase [Clostridia bacterium]|nr:dipicolinate synthase [Clostridia bacterium]